MKRSRRTLAFLALLAVLLAAGAATASAAFGYAVPAPTATGSASVAPEPETSADGSSEAGIDEGDEGSDGSDGAVDGIDIGIDDEQAEDVSVAAAELDIDTLVERLRDTRAIGIFTKLALRNDVEALLDDTQRALVNGKEEEIPKLRSRFDGLVLKTVALLDGRDDELAQDIYQAREFVWRSILEMQA